MGQIFTMLDPKAKQISRQYYRQQSFYALFISSCFSVISPLDEEKLIRNYVISMKKLLDNGFFISYVSVFWIHLVKNYDKI